VILCLSHSLKWFSKYVFSVLVYPFFESTRLFSKKVPQWSLLLRFFRLSKHEKKMSLPSLGSWKIHWRGFHHILLITFSSLLLWPNVGSMLLSTEPSEAFLIRKPCSTLPRCLETFGPWRIFPECPYFEHQSCPWALNLYVFNTHSSFVT